MSPTSMAYLVLVVLIGLFISQNSLVRGEMGLECNSCGKDCSAVCGSRQFRSCCFNYIKKRSSGSALPKSSDSSEFAKRSLSSLPLMVLENESGNGGEEEMDGYYIPASLLNDYSSLGMIDGLKPIVHQRSRSDLYQKLSPKYWTIPHLGFQSNSYRYLSNQDREHQQH